jgi:hypothetical protein
MRLDQLLTDDTDDRFEALEDEWMPGSRSVGKSVERNGSLTGLHIFGRTAKNGATKRHNANVRAASRVSRLAASR